MDQTNVAQVHAAADHIAVSFNEATRVSIDGHSWARPDFQGGTVRVLFTTQPGHGHLDPMLPYARELRKAGHEVRVASTAAFGGTIEAAGFPAVPIGPPDAVRNDNPSAIATVATGALTEPSLRAKSDEIRRECEALRPLDQLPSLLERYASEPLPA